jgi:hypothetical protein
MPSIYNTTHAPKPGADALLDVVAQMTPIIVDNNLQVVVALYKVIHKFHGCFGKLGIVEA